MSHFIKVCSCGAVIAQCRCPSPDKTRTVVPNGCWNCMQKPILPEAVPCPEIPTLPAFTALESFNEPLLQFGQAWLRMSDVQAVSYYPGTQCIDGQAYVFLSCGESITIDEESYAALLAYLKGGQDE